MTATTRIEKFWIVTKPTYYSETQDILFETDIKGLLRQFAGVLISDDIVGTFLSGTEAINVAHELLAERDSSFGKVQG